MHLYNSWDKSNNVSTSLDTILNRINTGNPNKLVYNINVSYGTYLAKTCFIMFIIANEMGCSNPINMNMNPPLNNTVDAV